ncbi:MAG TPA: ABC transporter permease [Actinomycetota bacterium]|nr:ABC transporter permease [Actinomycetota bacterium]
MSDDPAVTDRGMWRVVAARDFSVRLRDKGFAISTAITITVLSIFILLRAYAGGPDSFALAVVGDRAVADRAAAIAERAGIDLRVVPLRGEGVVERALRDGRVDAALVGGQADVLGGLATLRVLRDVPSLLDQVVQAAAIATRLEDALEDAGASADTIEALQDQHPVGAAPILPPDPDRDTKAAVALAAVLVLYGQLFGYGVWVATGVIEEKSSRVVEVLLSTIRARHLMAGKIAGIGTLGLLQLILVAIFAVSLATVTGAIDIPADSLSAAALTVGWFVLGFSFYAALFAVAGALVSRMEELQNAIVPINLVVFASFFISIGAVDDPDSGIAKIASLLPISSALAMPVRMVLGSATTWQIVASLAIVIGSTALLIPLAGRVYAGAILRTGGRVKVRDAWRAAG